MELTCGSNLSDLITQLSTNNGGQQITFENLKNELSRKDNNNNFVYNINIKDYDNLAIIYYNDTDHNHSSNSTSPSTKPETIRQLEQNCRSCILEKSTLKFIASQFNRIVYNDDAKDILKNAEWNKVLIQKCYEGTVILLFNYNNTWYVSTRRCLKAEDSVWIKNKSYRDMFDEAIAGKFTFDELNKDYCYHFVLVHHKNRNIVNYSYISKEKEYKDVYHIMTTKKYTLEEVDYVINDKVNTCKQEQFDNLDKVLEKLEQINSQDKQQHRITAEGYIIRAYTGELKKSPFVVLKLQTEIYQHLVKLKPNNSNIHQGYLELYQKDKLAEYLPYFTKYSNDIIKRINVAMKTVAKELLDVYHCTRQKKNPHVYNLLSETYKKILYGLHGLYISSRKQDFQPQQQQPQPQTQAGDNNKEPASKSINVHDVYHYLKTISSYELRQLFFERMSLLDKDGVTFINKNCIYTVTQSMLMFKK